MAQTKLITLQNLGCFLNRCKETFAKAGESLGLTLTEVKNYLRYTTPSEKKVLLTYSNDLLQTLNTELGGTDAFDTMIADFETVLPDARSCIFAVPKSADDDIWNADIIGIPLDWYSIDSENKCFAPASGVWDAGAESVKVNVVSYYNGKLELQAWVDWDTLIWDSETTWHDYEHDGDRLLPKGRGPIEKRISFLEQNKAEIVRLADLGDTDTYLGRESKIFVCSADNGNIGFPGSIDRILFDGEVLYSRIPDTAVITCATDALWRETGKMAGCSFVRGNKAYLNRYQSNSNLLCYMHSGNNYPIFANAIKVSIGNWNPHKINNCPLLEEIELNGTTLSNSIYDPPQSGSYLFSPLPSLRRIICHNITVNTDANAAFSGNSKLVDISEIGRWTFNQDTSMAHFFSYCTSLESTEPMLDWDFSRVTELSYMCAGCTSLRKANNLLKIDAPKVTAIEGIFQNTPKIYFTDDGNCNWNMPLLTNASKAFSKCGAQSLTLAISSESLTDVHEFAAFCPNLEVVRLNMIGNITNISNMFAGCNKLSELRLSCNLGSLTNTNGMFEGCTALRTLYRETYRGPLPTCTDKLKISLDVSDCPLNNPSQILEWLYDFSGETAPSTTPTIAFSNHSYNLLTDEQIAAATAKGWTLTCAPEPVAEPTTEERIVALEGRLAALEA